MKKISILSYPNTNNYGGLLQLYALSKILSLKYNVEVISYKNSSTIKRTVFRSFLSFFYRNVFKFLSNNIKRIKSEKKFKLLIPITNQTFVKSKDVETINTDFFLVGSDQVWNPYLNGFDDCYLLNFNTTAKKNSYAASFGIEKIPQKWIDKLGESLRSFNHISVREKTGLGILDSIPCLENVSKTVDLDPTLLLSKDEWEKTFCEKRIIKEKYILVYLMPGDKCLERKMITYAKKCASATSSKLIVIGRKDIDRFNLCKKGYYHFGPGEFVNLINFANLVITNSFHGTIFSINMCKDFISFINSSQNAANSLKSRIVDFLDQMSLTNQLVDISIIKNPNIQLEPIDYNAIIGRLSALRTKSLKNLFESFK